MARRRDPPCPGSGSRGRDAGWVEQTARSSSSSENSSGADSSSSPPSSTGYRHEQAAQDRAFEERIDALDRVRSAPARRAVGPPERGRPRDADRTGAGPSSPGAEDRGPRTPGDLGWAHQAPLVHTQAGLLRVNPLHLLMVILIGVCVSVFCESVLGYLDTRVEELSTQLTATSPSSSYRSREDIDSARDSLRLFSVTAPFFRLSRYLVPLGVIGYILVRVLINLNRVEHYLAYRDRLSALPPGADAEGTRAGRQHLPPVAGDRGRPGRQVE